MAAYKKVNKKAVYFSWGTSMHAKSIRSKMTGDQTGGRVGR
jgi:hypothetical protein